MSARLLTAGDPLWQQVLAETEHDIYHRPEYARVDATSSEDPLAVWIEAGDHGLLMPMLRRRIRGVDMFDAISPYGYSGPLWLRGEVAPPALRQVFSAELHELLAAESIVSFMVRLHPLLNTAKSLDGFGTFVEHGETVAIDLREDLATIRAHMRQTHRNEIAQAERQHVTILHDPGLTRLDEFIGLYQATMRHVGATNVYLFERPYFEALRAQLGDHLHLVLAYAGGQLAAGALLFRDSGIVQYHLAGMNRDLRRTRAAKLVLANAIAWAREGGNRWMHLGGGVGAKRDGVFAFKAGFSPLRWRFHTLRVIANEDSYRALGGLGKLDPLDVAEGFFPRYRQGSS